MLTDWHLALTGLGGETRRIGYADLDARARHTVPYTFECIGNPVGGRLIGNALWRVVPLAEVLALAPGGLRGARSVMMKAMDGFYASVTIERATDAYAFLALDMNGVPLPAGHGFPVRVILPGLYGKKQPRWLTEITLLEDADTTSYWERRLWRGGAAPEYEARFDPRPTASPEAPLQFTGMAIAGASGVGGVQVSLDDGETCVWAEQTTPARPHVWSLWRYTWPRPTPVRHRLA
ncbi:MAG: molybdopterin-dependent oxidoreductase, partial [Bacteroidota bacterium]